MVTIKVGEFEVNVEEQSDLLGDDGKMLMSRKSFLNILLSNDKPRLFSMVTDTNVEMNQYLDYWLVNHETGKRTKNPNPTRNPYFDGGVNCLSRKYKLVTCFDYEKCINDRLVKEGKEPNHVNSDKIWYEHHENHLSVVTDKKTHTKFYLQYQYCVGSVLEMTYLYEGSPIDKGLIEGYLPNKTDYSGQGLDNTLNVQVVNIENILEISFNNHKYILYGGFDD